MSGKGTTLLIGFDPRTALAVARSLTRGGVRIVVATLADWETPVSSRAVAAYVRLPRLEESPSIFLRELQRVIDSQEVDTVIPLTDRALVALAPHDAELRKKVWLLAPTPAQTALILDKTATARLATEVGIPVPTTLTIEGKEGLSEVERRLKFPVFLKPQSKATSCRRPSAPGPEVFACETPAALRERLRANAAAKRETFLVQEKAPGDDVGLAVVMRQGEPVSTFQYRAQRMWPANGGVCVAACSEPLSPEMLECSLRMLRALKWEGVAELDFRHDRATGRFVLLEINGRFWGSTAAALVAGADMPRAVWQLAHGQTPAANRYRGGRRVRWLEGDLRRLSELARTASAVGGWTQMAKELAAFFWDFRPAVSGMYWSWHDPVPALHSLRILAQWWCFARVRNAWRKLRRPAQPLSRAKPATPVLSP